jgi:hypothetical protein
MEWTVAVEGTLKGPYSWPNSWTAMEWTVAMEGTLKGPYSWPNSWTAMEWTVAVEGTLKGPYSWAYSWTAMEWTVAVERWPLKEWPLNGRFPLAERAALNKRTLLKSWEKWTAAESKKREEKWTLKWTSARASADETGHGQNGQMACLRR